MKVSISEQRRTISIVASGTLDRAFVPEIKKSGFIIGVDKGAYWLIRHGLVPNLAIGDFDSVTKAEMTEIEKLCQVKKFSSEKDWTDLELAVIEAIKLKGNYSSHIVIYGAIGTRLDHTLAAIGLLTVIEKAGKYGLIKDMHNEISLVSDTSQYAKNTDFPYISIIPMSGSAVVTLSGFKYDAEKLTIRAGTTIGVSNEIIGRKAVIIPHRGKVLVIRSRD